MKLPILSSVIVFILVLTHTIKRSNRTTERLKREYLERERKANFVRRKPLDNLDYITIPLDTLPMDELVSEKEVAECIETIKELSVEKIVNFTGLSNTDLKLEYGTANIDILTTYDSRYTLLVRTLQTWGRLLFDAEKFDAAKSVLEFAVSTKTDVKGTYELLIQIYYKQKTPEKIQNLLTIANELNSAMKDPIVRILQEACQ